MSEISSKCTLFTTSVSDEKLSRLLLDLQNRAMGAGGYAIERSRDKPGNAIHICFQYLDSSPSPRHQAFIKDGKIWVTHMSGWLMTQLMQRKIGFTTKQVATPPFIADYMKGRLTVD